MDGNGRQTKNGFCPRVAWNTCKGVNSLKNRDSLQHLGVKYLTVFAFGH